MEHYESPVIVDHGDLQQLTADCIGGAGGDSKVPGGEKGGFEFGTQTSTCTSNPPGA